MDGDQTVAVYENGAVKYWNILANGVTGRYEPGSGAKFFYLKDHLGSTRVVVDAAGTVKEALDYYPFGLLMPGRTYQSSSETKEKFTGKELDSETGWYHFTWWPYAAEIGRWPQPDPLADDYFGWSSYNYALNNPTNLIDFAGLSVKAVKTDSGYTIFDVVDDNDPTIYVYDDPDGEIVDEINLNDDLELKEKIYKSLERFYAPEFLANALFLDLTPARDFALGASWVVVGGTAGGALTSYLSSIGLSSAEINVAIQWLRTTSQATTTALNSQVLQVFIKLEILAPGIIAWLYRTGYQSATNTPAPKLKLGIEFIQQKYQEIRKWIDVRNSNSRRKR